VPRRLFSTCIMAESIDWYAGYEEDLDVKATAEELCDHWRGLAIREHEERLSLTWMFEELLRLSSAYPKVMREKLESEWAKRGGTS